MKAANVCQTFPTARAAFQFWAAGLAEQVPICTLVDRRIFRDCEADIALKIHSLVLNLNFFVLLIGNSLFGHCDKCRVQELWR